MAVEQTPPRSRSKDEHCVTIDSTESSANRFLTPMMMSPATMIPRVSEITSVTTSTGVVKEVEDELRNKTEEQESLKMKKGGYVDQKKIGAVNRKMKKPLVGEGEEIRMAKKGIVKKKLFDEFEEEEEVEEAMQQAEWVRGLSPIRTHISRFLFFLLVFLSIKNKELTLKYFISILLMMVFGDGRSFCCFIDAVLLLAACCIIYVLHMFIGGHHY